MPEKMFKQQNKYIKVVLQVKDKHNSWNWKLSTLFANRLKYVFIVWVHISSKNRENSLHYFKINGIALTILLFVILNQDLKVDILCKKDIFSCISIYSKSFSNQNRFYILWYNGYDVYYTYASYIGSSQYNDVLISYRQTISNSTKDVDFYMDTIKITFLCK